jgi:hypothetical protein
MMVGRRIVSDLPPDLMTKINLNNLAVGHKILIQAGALRTGHVDKYFAANSKFALDELKSHVVGVYEAAKTSVIADPSASGTSVVDAVFIVFRRSLCPKNATTGTAAAVDAVIGYFFEACDVFDPKAAKGLPGASP